MVGGPFPLFRSAKSAAAVCSVALRVACVAVVVAAGVGCPNGSSGKTAELRVAEAVHDFGGAETAWSLGVWSTGADGKALGFTAQADQPWVNVTPISGASTGPEDIATLSLTIDRTKATNKAADGSYTAMLTISADGTDPVNVTLKARDPLPTIGLSETSHDFAAVGTEWSFTVWNAGEAGSTLNFAAAADSNWISVKPATGSSADVNHPVTVAVSIDRGAMAKGQYAGAITISATGASPRTIPLTARDAVAGLAVSDTTHDFGTTGSAWSFDVWNSGEAGSTLNFSVASNQTWLTANPAAGSSTGVGDKRTIAVAVARGALAAGNYAGNLTVSAGGVTPRIIAVTVRVPATAVAVSDTLHDFGFAETAWSFQVWNGGEAGSQLNFNVTSNKPWIKVSPAAGASASSTDKKTIAVTLVRDTLTRGAYSGAITVSNSSGATRTIAIAARAPEPAVTVSAASHDFGYLETAWAFDVWNGGETGSVLTFQATVDKPWVSLTPVTGTSSGAQNKQSIAVRLDRSKLGTAQATATITVAGAYVQPKTLTVQATPAVAPAANFTAGNRNIFAGESVTFADASTAGTAPITRWAWTFGDGGSSAQQNPSHTYASEGTFAVALTVTSAHGTNTKTVAGFVTVTKKAAPKAGFAAASVDVPKGTPVAFADQSQPGTAPLTAWAWNFGDGATSTAQNPSHAYVRTGQFDVQLTVTSDHGANTALKSNYITVKAQAPTAEFAASDVAPRIGQVVVFTDLSTPGTSPITARTWNFGDGTGVSHAQNPTHTYTTPGIFTVSLTVTTADGADTETKTDFIQVVIDPPVAAFVGAPLVVDTRHYVQFTDQSQAGSGDIVIWLWSFGDGTTSAERNPSHQYSVYGTYSVSLTVTSSYSVSTTQSRVGYVSVEPRDAVANFSVSDSNPYRWEILHFTDLSDPGSTLIIEWLWDFGDGNTSTARNPSHVYLLEGTYTVTLTITTLLSSDSTTQTVVVRNPEIRAHFTVDRKIYYIGLDDVILTDTSEIEGPHASRWTEFDIWQGALDPVPRHSFAVGTGLGQDLSVTLMPEDGLYYQIHDAGLYNVRMLTWTTGLTDPGDPHAYGNNTYWSMGSVLAATAFEARQPADIDRFLRIERLKGLSDPFTYSKVATLDGNAPNGVAYTAYVLSLTSQQWWINEGAAHPNVSNPADNTWQHWLTVIVPASHDETMKTALLYITGGDKGEPAPLEVAPELAQFATVSRSIVAVVTQVPNQPMTFTDFPTPLGEDEMLAYSLDKFLDTGDVFWPALYPMVKSTERAMDAVVGFLAGESYGGPWPPIEITDFVVAGAGNRAWSTWLTAATDERVRGIIPMAFDFLDIWTQLVRLQDPEQLVPAGYATAWEPYGTAQWNVLGRIDPPGYMGYALDWEWYRRMLELRVREIIRDWLHDDDDRGDLDHIPELLQFIDSDELRTPYPYWDLIRSFPWSTPVYVQLLRIAAYLDPDSDYWANRPPAPPESNYELDLPIYISGLTGPGSPLYSYGGPQPDGGLYDISLAPVVAEMITRQEQARQAVRGSLLLYLVDPDAYNEKYNYLLDWWGEYGGRLNMPKYIVNSPGDAYFFPDSTHNYYANLDAPKYLRFIPNTGHKLLGYEETVLSAVAWFMQVTAGVNPDVPYTWTDYGEGITEVQIDAGLTPTEVNLWTARCRDNDWRLDDVFRPPTPGQPAAPAWTKTPLSEIQAGTGKYLVDVPKDQIDFKAYVIEVVFAHESGYPLVYTTDVKVVQPVCPGCTLDPTADFQATPLNPAVGAVVTFTDKSNPGSSDITNWLWDFGDGTAGSVAQNPTHIYTSAGAYTVTLTVTTADGTDTRVKSAYINVHS